MIEVTIVAHALIGAGYALSIAGNHVGDQHIARWLKDAGHVLAIIGHVGMILGH